MMCGIYSYAMHPYSILVDSTTLGRTSPQAIMLPQSSFVEDAMHDGHRVRIGCQCPHADKTLFLIKADPEEYPRWTWNYKERAFLRQCRDAHRRVARALTARHGKNEDGVLHDLSHQLPAAQGAHGPRFSGSIYLAKQMAQRLKDSGYDEASSPSPLCCPVRRRYRYSPRTGGERDTTPIKAGP